MVQFKRESSFRELTVSLAEKDIELERLQTTLAALTKKLNLINDQKLEETTYIEAMRKAERERDELHQHFIQTSERFGKDNQKYLDQNEAYVQQIGDLQGQIQELKNEKASGDMRLLECKQEYE